MKEYTAICANWNAYLICNVHILMQKWHGSFTSVNYIVRAKLAYRLFSFAYWQFQQKSTGAQPLILHGPGLPILFFCVYSGGFCNSFFRAAMLQYFFSSDNCLPSGSNFCCLICKYYGSYVVRKKKSRFRWFLSY